MKLNFAVARVSMIGLSDRTRYLLQPDRVSIMDSFHSYLNS